MVTLISNVQQEPSTDYKRPQKVKQTIMDNILLSQETFALTHKAYLQIRDMDGAYLSYLTN